MPTDPHGEVAAADAVATGLGGCDVVCANVGVRQFGAVDRCWVTHGTVRADYEERHAAMSAALHRMERS